MTGFHPLVSIIIPVYNGSNYMRSAIDSALGQTYGNCEVVVVNDGSTDATDEIAQGYGDRIRYFKKENGGVATALNMAIEKAKGEYISWLSHDDYYMPEKVAAQVEALAEVPEDARGKLIPFCDHRIIDIAGGSESDIIVSDAIKNYPPRTVSDILHCLKLLYGWLVSGCSLLIPKAAFAECKEFDPALRTTQDYDMWFRMLRAGYRFFYVPRVLQASRVHNEQDSTVKRNLLDREAAAMWRRMDLEFKTELDDAAAKDGTMRIMRVQKRMFAASVEAKAQKEGKK